MNVLQGHKYVKPIQLGVICVLLLLSIAISVALLPPVQAAGATSSLHIVKYDKDGTKILGEKTVTYQWLEKNLPVQGDGHTHYYLQGPVFEGDMWDPLETTNLKDKGAVKGTNIKDICELVGGMSPGDEVMIVAVDGWQESFAYPNVYEPLDRQGMITLCWYNGEDAKFGETYGVGYPGSDAYSTAIQVVLMPRTTNAEGQYVFGNSDMKVCMPQEKYQHFYEGFPSTNGLSGKWITEVRIYTGGVPKNLAVEKGQGQPANDNRWDPIALGALAVILLGLGIYLVIRQKGFRTRPGKIDIRAIVLLVAGVLCVITSLAVYFYVPQASNPNIAWDVTIIGNNGKENKVSYDAIREMPAYEGTGGFFTTAGVINGPFPDERRDARGLM